MPSQQEVDIFIKHIGRTEFFKGLHELQSHSKRNWCSQKKKGEKKKKKLFKSVLAVIKFLNVKMNTQGLFVLNAFSNMKVKDGYYYKDFQY